MIKSRSFYINLRSRYYKFCAYTARLESSGEPISEIYSTGYSEVPVILRSTCRLDRLRFNILGLGKVSIWDTPHYEFLVGRDMAGTYPNYIQKHYGLQHVQPVLTRFLSLESNLRENPDRRVLLSRSEIPCSKLLFVLDGTHRAAHFALQGDTYVDVALSSQ